MSVRVLFVCTGNICRSPFAELLARQLVAELPPQHQASEWRFASAGVAGLTGWPMDDQMAAQLQARGGSADDFRARQLTGAMAHASDLLLVMAPEHRIHILDEWPDLVRRTWLLGQAARAASQLVGPVSGGPGRSGAESGDAVPGAADLVSMLRRNPAPPMSSDAIADPYRRGRAAAAKAASEIETALRQVLGA